MSKTHLYMECTFGNSSAAWKLDALLKSWRSIESAILYRESSAGLSRLCSTNQCKERFDIARFAAFCSRGSGRLKEVSSFMHFQYEYRDNDYRVRGADWLSL